MSVAKKILSGCIYGANRQTQNNKMHKAKLMDMKMDEMEIYSVGVNIPFST